MKKIIYMLMLLAAGNIYASANDDGAEGSLDNISSHSSQSGSRFSSPSGSRVSTELPDYSEGSAVPVIVASSQQAVDDGDQGEIVIPGEVPTPVSMELLMPLASLVHQIPTKGIMLAPLTVIACINRAHNPVTITVPSEHPGLVSMFTILGTRAIKGGQRREIGLQIPVVSVDPIKMTADSALKTFWAVFKGHDAERHIIHYAPQGVFTYRLTPDGKFVEKTSLTVASDAARSMVMVIDHGKLPGIRLTSELEALLPRKGSMPKLPAVKTRK
jgi:hypothetical protein